MILIYFAVGATLGLVGLAFMLTYPFIWPCARRMSDEKIETELLRLEHEHLAIRGVSLSALHSTPIPQLTVVIRSLEIRGPSSKTPILLFLHDAGASSLAFLPLMKRLSSLYSSISVDLPGFGRSSCAQSEDPDFVRIVVHSLFLFLRKRNLDHVAVIGHGFGGLVAARLALDFPDLVSNLILVGPVGMLSSASFPGFQLWGALIRSTPFPPRWRRWGTLLVSWFAQDPYSMLLWLSAGARGYAALPQALRTSRSAAAALVTSPIPILLLYGEKDPLSSQGMEMHLTLGVDLVLLSRLGHCPFESSKASKTVAGRISEFLHSETVSRGGLSNPQFLDF